MLPLHARYALIAFALCVTACDSRSTPSTRPAAKAPEISIECMRRVRTADGLPVRFTDAAEEHDAWIETDQRLEDALQKNPGRLDLLRDLVIADTSLLSFEAGSLLKSRVCRMAASAASRFEAAGGSVDSGGQRLIAQARQFTFHAMGLYPCMVPIPGANQAVDLDGQAGLKALALSGVPTHFLGLETRTLGMLTCTLDRTLDVAPDARLLWDELFFTVSPSRTRLPENTVAYVLSRQGEGPEARYYLFFRSIQGERLISPFGRQRPSIPSLRAIVDQSIAEATTPPRPNEPTFKQGAP